MDEPQMQTTAVEGSHKAGKPVSKAALIWTAILCIVASSAISLGVSYKFFAQKASVPQVRFVNMTALTDVFNTRFTDDAEKAEALKVLNANLNYLGNQGVVLLNTSAMVSAPAVLLINHEALLPGKQAPAQEQKAEEKTNESQPAGKK